MTSTHRKQELYDQAAEASISICKASPSDAHRIGIHLLHPSLSDLSDALETAQRDGFSTIFIHNALTWPRRSARTGGAK